MNSNQVGASDWGRILIKITGATDLSNDSGIINIVAIQKLNQTLVCKVSHSSGVFLADVEWLNN